MDFLLRLFVKDYDNCEKNSKTRARWIKYAGWIGVLTNLLLFAGKLLAGMFSKSIALIADAVNNLTDSTSSIVMLVGVKLSEKPADDDHPFGHARIEYITGVVVSFIILFLGVQMGISSVKKIINPEEIAYSPVVFVIMIVSILLKAWQSMFYRAAGEKVHSEMLKAASGDSRNDVIATSAIFISALIMVFFHVNLDGIFGLLTAVFIVYSGIQFVKETANPLLGTAPEESFVKEIQDEILAYDGVIGMHDLTVHNYGANRCFVTVHCEVPAEKDILISHDIIDNIERDFMEKHRIHLVIHLDPIVTNDEKTNLLRAEIEKIREEIYPESSMHDFRVVWGISHSNILFDLAVPFSEKDSDSEIKEKIGSKIKQISDSYNEFITIDRMSKVNLHYL
jgi:cation diffusion facilitator family transporter